MKPNLSELPFGRQSVAIALSIILCLTCVAFPPAARALDVVPNQKVVLKARKPLGVQLHRFNFLSLFGRVADGTTETVVETDAEKHWLKLSLPENPDGWIVEGYVANVLPIEGGGNGGGGNGGDGTIPILSDEASV
ncbi:MAG: hypothetical protein AAFY57_18340 [Cyanobacteria bacterium J06642_2]